MSAVIRGMQAPRRGTARPVCAVLPGDLLEHLSLRGGFFPYVASRFGPGEYACDLVYAGCEVETIYECTVPAAASSRSRRQEPRTVRAQARQLAAQYFDEILREQDPPTDVLDQFQAVVKKLEENWGALGSLSFEGCMRAVDSLVRARVGGPRRLNAKTSSRLRRSSRPQNFELV